MAQHVQATKDIFTSEEPQLASVKNLGMFCTAGSELWVKMGKYGKVKVTSSLSVKVTDLLNQYSFCYC